MVCPVTSRYQVITIAIGLRHSHRDIHSHRVRNPMNIMTEEEEEEEEEEFTPGGN